jgi:hypothetical protein
VAVSLANPLKAKKLFDREAKRNVIQAVEDAWEYLKLQDEKEKKAE